MRDNNMKIRKVRADGNKHYPAWEEWIEGYMPSSLGDSLISVGRQAVSETKILRIDNFYSVSSKA